MNADYGARKLDPFMGLKVAGIKGSKSTMLHGSSVGRRTSMVPNYSLSPAVWLLSVMLGLLPLLWVTVSEGQTTSITSSGLGTTITSGSIDPAGRPNYIITGGTRPGDGPNLFHSFGDFSVGTNNVARFFNETGRSTTNILSRVTGGQTSNIYGTIQTAGFGTAALWLINPAGIVFGPSASLNVGGSVHFSTADYLRLGSGNDRFYADLGKTSQLTSAPVTAFGFLAELPNEIKVEGGPSNLSVAKGQSLSLVGGPVSITGRTISAPEGQINVASVAVVTAGLVSEVPVADRVAGGAVLIRRGQFVGADTGAVTLGNNAVLQSDATPGGKAGGIDIETNLLVMNPGTTISASTQGNSNAGGITISANDRVTISGATISNSSMFGDTGNMNITSPRLFLENGGRIDAFTGVAGSGGKIAIQVTDLSIANNSAISTSTQTGTGSAGDISITASNQVSLMSGGSILSGTAGGGNSGNITISARDISLTDNGSSVTTQSSAAGTNGNISIEATTLTMKPGTIIASHTFEEGTTSAGNIDIHATDSVSMSGAVISSTENPEGLLSNQGNVTITAGRAVSLTNNSSIVTRSAGLNDSGNVAITAGDITLTDQSFLKTDTLGGSTGNAGNIVLNTAALTLNPGTSIAASTSGSGNAGHISITATDHVTLSGSGTKVATDTSSTGNAGSIIINTKQLTIADGGDISSSSTSNSEGAGSAGQIVIRGQAGEKSFAQSVTLDNGAISTTVRQGSATTSPAGIDVRAQSVTLTNAAVIQAQTFGTAPAGNIHIETGTMSMTSASRVPMGGTPTAFILASTNGPGRGGDITIDATGPVTISGSGIGSESTGRTTGRFIGQCPSACGQAGNVTITAPALTLESVESIIHRGLTKDSSIFTDTSGSGAAGTITLDVGSLLIRDSIMPSSLVAPIGRNGLSAGTIGSGAGGSIKIIADSIRLEHGLITAAGGGSGGASQTGAPGTIDISAGSLTLVNGSLIRSNNNGPTFVRTVNPDGTITQSGTVTIHGKGKASFADTVSISDSTLFTGTTAMANGGPLNIAANTINATDGALLSSSSSSTATGAGDAGNIQLTSGNNIFITNSKVTTSAVDASGGNIKLTAPNMVRLVGAELSSNVTGKVGGPGGNGGNISIDPQYVILQGNSLINASATGFGGKITIQASRAILQEPGTILNATGGSPELDGVISIQAPFQQLSGAIAPLPQVFAVATNLYGQRCAAEKGGQFSSFVQGARDGVPPQPGDLIPSPLMLELDEVPLSSSLQSTSSLSAIRLGLPGFEQSSRSSLTVFSGCRS